MKLNKHAVKVFFVLVLLSLSITAAAQRINDFALFDQHGTFHQLSYYKNNKAVILLVDQVGGNSNVRAQFQSLAKEENNAEIVFMMLSPGGVDKQLPLHSQDISLPNLNDDIGLVSNLLGVTRVGEVLLLDPKRSSVLYRGQLGESLNLAIKEISSDLPLSNNKTPLINLPLLQPSASEKNQKIISYQNDVAPTLIKHCVVCHRENGVAPFAMDSWGVVLGWSPMIKEVLMTKRMPPGQIDPSIGHFKNGRALSAEEVAQLINWIDAGGVNDSDEDPLENFVRSENEWALGKPDLIVDLPEQSIPATGLIDYTDIVLSIPLIEDRWVRGTQFVPGDQRVLHHAEAFVVPLKLSGESAVNPKVVIAEHFLSAFNNSNNPDAALFAPYVPGAKPESLPSNTGGILKANSQLAVQLHYAAIGREVKDQTRLGLWFYPKDNKPENRMVVGCACLDQTQWKKIPAYEENFVAKAELLIDKNVYLYSVFPQMHYRGSAIRFDAHLPNGEVEPLLSIPKYNFNWQIDYQFEQPKFVAAGTKIVATATYNNSSKNEFNPDASQDVPWGRESYNEILAGVFQWKVVD